MTNFINTSEGNTIAYNQIIGKNTGIIFLSGYNSDMQGTKALYIEKWAKENNHQLILVSAQRPQCVEPTEAWLQRWGFVGFDEIHFEKNKHLVDVDMLIDDSPEKLKDFRNKSINGGIPVCMKQSWNQECHNRYMSIDRLSDIMTRVFG